MKALHLVFAGLVLCCLAQAKVVTEPVAYQHDGVALEGYLAYDEAREGRQPGVIVVHEWWGLNDFAKEKARELAELGYVALAIDMYGKGTVTDDRQRAGQLAGQFRGDPALWRARAKAGYDALVRQERVDSDRIAAIGFCFGGTTVLHMAADGLPLRGVVSFHGSLFPFSADDVQAIKAKILVLHGDADTHVPPASVQAFEESLRGSPVDWHLVAYGGAKHGYMNRAADELGMEGVGYDAKAAKRSWQHMRAFFDEILQRGGPPGAGERGTERSRD